MASDECVQEMYAIARDHIKQVSRSLKQENAYDNLSDTDYKDDDLTHTKGPFSESIIFTTQKRKLSEDIAEGLCGQESVTMTSKSFKLEDECADPCCSPGVRHDLTQVCSDHSASSILDHVARDQTMDMTLDMEPELTHSERKENMQALDMVKVLQHITQSGTPFEIIEMNEGGCRNVSDVICRDAQPGDHTFIPVQPILDDQLDDSSSSPVTCSVSDDPVSSVNNVDQSLIVSLFHALGEKPPEADTGVPMDSPPNTSSSGLNTPCVASPQPYLIPSLQSPSQLPGMLCSQPVAVETQFNHTMPKGYHVRIDGPNVEGLQNYSTRFSTPVCLVANSTSSDTLTRTFRQQSLLQAGGHNSRRTLIPIENWPTISSVGQHVTNQSILPAGTDLSKHGHILYMQNNAASQGKALYAYPQHVIAKGVAVSTVPVTQHEHNTSLPVNQHTANSATEDIQYPLTGEDDQYKDDNDENSSENFQNDLSKSGLSVDPKIEGMRILNPHLFPDLGDDDLGREQHNYKERIRRARIRDACVLMRQLVPGMSDKTDKATVFEFAARYIHYIKTYVGNQHDKDFLLKYSPY